MKFGTKSLIALAAVASLHTAASALTIDGFDSPVGGQTSFEGPGLPGFSGPMTGGISAFRYIDVERTGGPGQLTLAINNTVPGVAAISSDTATSGNFLFAYGNFNPDAPIPTSANFLSEGHDRVSIGVLRADNLYAVEFSIRDGAGATVTVTKPVAAVIGLQTIEFLYADFLAINPALNLADVDGVQMKAIGSLDLDTQVDIIRTSTGVPVPAAVWAGGALLGGLVVRRLRRKA
jgi:hypothetical protein